MRLTKSKRTRKMRGTRYMGHAAKKHKGKGNTGGKGMAGTGKRADQKKTYVLKYLKDYFGRKSLVSRKKLKTKISSISLRDVVNILEKSSENKINLENNKIIGSSDIKKPITITAYDFSQKAKESIEKAGGKCIALKKEPVKKEN
jgi:large subunit ribosomal protein L15